MNSSWEINIFSRNSFSWPQVTQGIDELKHMSYSYSLNYYLQFNKHNASLHLDATNIIQLLTNEALDMMWYRPENINIDRGEAEVNIGILWSISHHIKCLISQ